MPYWDAVPTTFHLVGLWMLAKKLLESWTVLILGNAGALALYAFKDLYLLAGVQVVLTWLSVAGHREWRRELQASVRSS